MKENVVKGAMILEILKKKICDAIQGIQNERKLRMILQFILGMKGC